MTTSGGELRLVYVLLEHQSTVDRLMAYRMLRYVGRIWDEWLKGQPEAKQLPRVVPVVLFAGEGPWTAPTSVESLVDGGPAPWVPRMSFILDDLS